MPQQNFYGIIVIFSVRNFFSEEMATSILDAKGAGSLWKSYLSISQTSANFDCCFVWVWNLVSHTGGGTQAEGILEQDAEEDTWG